jgi:MFS family permease
MAASPTNVATGAYAAAPSERDEHRWWALAATCFGLFMALLDVTVVNVALPTMQRSLHAQLSDLQWITNVYTIALAVFLVTGGRLADAFGRKLFFMPMLAVFTVGSLLCGLSSGLSIGAFTHIQILWAARAIQGLGGAVMVPVSLAIIATTFEGRQRGTAIGIWSGIVGLSTAIGPLIGGVLVANIGWESIFSVNVPIGLIGIAVSA